MSDLYKVLDLLFFSPFCSLSVLLAGFGVYLQGIVCLWLHTCVYLHVCTEEVNSSSAAASLNVVNFLVRIEPKVPYLFCLPLSTCGFPASQIHSRKQRLLSLRSSLSLLSALLSLKLSTSVPVLVLVVPAVEVYVERHNAAGRHASDQSPAGRAQTQESHL